jgi:hypothetical protein
MQETKTRTPADESPTPRPSWIRVVALLAAVALFGGVLFATWQVVGGDNAGSNENSGGETEPDFSLTDDQAIARFEELDQLRVQAYRSADIGLVSDFAGPGPFKEQVVDEIRRLRRDNVTASLELRNEELTILSNSSQRIEIEQSADLNIRFFDPDGDEVTTEGRSQHVVIDWSLEPTALGWLMATSVVTGSELDQ